MPEQAVQAPRPAAPELTEALAHDDRGAAVEAFLRRVGMPPEAVAGMRHSPGWAGMEALAPTLAYDDAAMGDSRVPALDGLRAAVLALAGGGSPGFLQYGARTVAEAAGGRFELLPNETHDISPAAAAAALVPFVAG